MRVAVIGGGTAGFMAAAHLTKYCPTVALTHIYDSRIPTIGVGEGTVPIFKKWIHEISGLTYAELQARCDITQKFGIRFENWGERYKHYWHAFSTREGYAYHISAQKLVELLREYVTGTYLDQKVVEVKSKGESVTLLFEDQTRMAFDVVIDARGFPKMLDRNHIELSSIPTNAALIRRGAATDFQTATRAVARPYGWIFVIPLASATSYGYIYNDRINSQPEVEADLNQFARMDRAKDLGPVKQVHFPNFVRRIFFDGALFYVGNAASFLEPLEATAIANIILQLHFVSYWILNKMLGISSQDQASVAIKLLNEYLLDFIQKTALFVSWHYAKGSCFATPFWQFARSSFEQRLKELANTKMLQEFEQFLQAGARLPTAPAVGADPSSFNNHLVPDVSLSTAFGGFLDISFSKVGYGIDYFPQTRHHVSPAVINWMINEPLG